jgi:hypothetical protein
LSKKHGGLLFTKAEMEELIHMAQEAGESGWELGEFKQAQV